MGFNPHQVIEKPLIEKWTNTHAAQHAYRLHTLSVGVVDTHLKARDEQLKSGHEKPQDVMQGLIDALAEDGVPSWENSKIRVRVRYAVLILDIFVPQ